MVRRGTQIEIVVGKIIEAAHAEKTRERAARELDPVARPPWMMILAGKLKDMSLKDPVKPKSFLVEGDSRPDGYLRKN